eukprot:scaffold98644_cov28-Tisochrysis_lutea.AAC.1
MYLHAKIPRYPESRRGVGSDDLIAAETLRCRVLWGVLRAQHLLYRQRSVRSRCNTLSVGTTRGPSRRGDM